jgi:hypothetical protein
MELRIGSSVYGAANLLGTGSGRVEFGHTSVGLCGHTVELCNDIRAHAHVSSPECRAKF